MHNLTKIKIFRLLLRITYPFAAVFIYPFALLKKKQSSGLFFFFDRYAMGGAQRVHTDILHSVADVPKQVYFTRWSPNDVLKNDFYSIPNTNCRDIHTWCDYLFFRLFSVHYYAFYLNRHKKAHVFSANSTFFYDLLPFLKKNIYITELLHNFSYGKKGFEFFGLASYQYLDCRMVIDAYTLANIKEQYAQYKVPSSYLERVQLIEPGVEVPPGGIVKDFTFPLRILYAGRGGHQKRVWLINRIVEYVTANKWPVAFYFAGSMKEELSDYTLTHHTYYGPVSKKEAMNHLYLQCHVIILTSAFEGFPMVIKEGMAHGCIPIVTALEGNKMHLKDHENALLIEAIENEQEVVRQGMEKIEALLKNPLLLQELSANAYAYANTHFHKKKFIKAYRQFLLTKV